MQRNRKRNYSRWCEKAQMNTTWCSLLWKEFHEHKWKLLSTTAILWSVAALGLFQPERGMLIGIHPALVMAIVPLAIFIGAGTATSERSRGTLRFLQSLPVPMWRVAIYKAAIGLATILISAMLTLAFVFVWLKLAGLLGASPDAFGDVTSRESPFVFTNHWYANSALVLTIVAGGFYFWTVATGVNRKDEVSAGAVALTVIVAWCLFVFTAWGLYGNSYGSFDKWPSATEKWLAVAGAATAPGGLATLPDAIDNQRQYLLPAAYVTGVTLLLLAAWYVFRFGRTLNNEIRSPQTAKIVARRLDWLGAPRQSPAKAIAWKQLRESGPIVLLGFAVVFAVFTVIFIVDSPHYRNNDYGRFLELFAEVSFAIGLAVALVAGIGVFLNDVSPGLNTFWRSRPIGPNLWFSTKFASGLTILMAAIYGPIILLAPPNLEFKEILVFPAITFAIFAAAAAMTCLVRNAVYAAILSIAAIYLGIIATALTVAGARVVRGGEWPEYFGDVVTDVSATQVGAGMVLTGVVYTAVAWLATRNDWGQKSRY
jgi:hypothetical protein